MKNVKISNLYLNKLKLKKEKQSKYNKYSKIEKNIYIFIHSYMHIATHRQENLGKSLHI